VVPAILPAHEVSLEAASFLRKRGEDRDVGETEILMEEGNIVLPRDCLGGARQRFSIDMKFLLGFNIPHVQINILLLLSAFSSPGASDLAPYSCHPIPCTVKQSHYTPYISPYTC